MKLHYSAASPFVRKVVATAMHHGIPLERVGSNPHASPAELLADNPLSKVPALVTDAGMTLPDSPLICEYLDSIGGAAKLYPTGEARWPALRLAALADGILTAAVLRRGQSLMPAEEARAGLIARQQAAVTRTLDLLETEGVPAALNIGTLTLVCALGYLDFRFGEEDWRPGRPKLTAFYEAHMANPIFAETVPAG
ncbi:glutathione S-transferase N-terminal domain-containing protein [Roseococcus sp. SDR]|uniref:glutathione S-transferase N-terminal domain-containing protein n=1 Tax=Roseococcus sp. SDR TaxID=2835532 RepID=UPI001BCCD4ED|nr:glutathione S-transferase N-terminal domain-containing protein [Roseococcus sp. SDR]MBS7791043.1 glutathione S-transferase N-terminal domain-containing protein [Roseococcus sp. SDR]MBV1846357.1 glutathione S-transferase N-terminal domain-containing protein [Roseococcus sp. SDR]